MSNTAKNIQLDQLNKHFYTGEEDLHVLNNISVTINPGQLSMLVGPSGCGKTTLISIIAGILQPDSGTINVFGHRLESISDRDRTLFRKHHVAFIFQQFNLVPTLSVLENVMLPLVIQGVSRTEAADRAHDMLATVGLGKRTTGLPGQLSGGEQQRVAIARALVPRPRLLVCDEPTAALDSKNGQKTLELIQETALHPERCVIVVTHDNRIFSYGDRIITMEDGRIIGS